MDATEPWPSADRDKAVSGPTTPSVQLLGVQMSVPFFIDDLAGDSWEQSPLELAALSENTGEGE